MLCLSLSLCLLLKVVSFLCATLQASCLTHPYLDVFLRVKAPLDAGESIGEVRVKLRLHTKAAVVGRVQVEYIELGANHRVQ